MRRPTGSFELDCNHWLNRAVENRAGLLIDLADWSPVPPDLDPLLRTALLSP